MKPIVSIITTTYNLEKYIGQCIQSVIDQTFSQWEMIIVDDGSTDSTVPIINDYLRTDRRIMLISHKKNWGVKRLKNSYNQALRISKGKYIAILEGDDYWPQYKLATQITALDKSNAVLSYGDGMYVDGNGNPFEIIYYRRNNNLLCNKPIGSILKLFIDLNFYLMPVTVIIKRDALLKIGGFQSSRSYYFVDFPTWLSLTLEGSFIYEKSILGFWRRHSKSIWLDFARKTEAMSRKEMQDTLIDFLSDKKKALEEKHIDIDVQKIIQSQREYIQKKHINRHLSLLKHYFAYGDRKDIKFQSLEIITDDYLGFKFKLLAILVLSLLPFRSQILSTLFLIKYFRYRIVQQFFYSTK